MALETDIKSSAWVELKSESDGKAILYMSGRLDSRGTSDIWRKTLRLLRSSNCGHIIVDAAGVEYCDGCGLGLLLEVSLLGQEKDFEVEVHGLDTDFQKLLDMFSATKFS